jgi:rhodanese-related sulfurtransferase
MAREVDQAAYVEAHASGHVTVDVREPHEYVAGHVPGAICIPLSRLATQLSDVPPGEPVYVICASGNRSKAGADILHRAGRDAWSVMGGTGAWAAAGRPVVVGASAA